MVQRAVIVIPPDLSLDSLYAKERIDYALDRGYQLAAVVRDWNEVDVSLALNTAQVVVVARSVYPDRECVTQQINPSGSAANGRGDRYARQTPAQRFLDATAERWSNEFSAWLLSRHPGE